MAARGLGDMFRRRSNFCHGVGHGHAQPDLANHRQIGQVVADVADLLGREMQVAQDIQGRGQLVLESLADDIDAQLQARSLTMCDVRAVSRPNLNPGSLPELDPQAIANVKALQLDALVVVPDAAVGQHAVHVGQDQLDRAAKVGEVHGSGSQESRSSGVSRDVTESGVRVRFRVQRSGSGFRLTRGDFGPWTLDLGHLLARRRPRR